MADENDDQENTDQDAEQSESGGGKSKLIIFIVLGLLLVGISVGGTLFMLGFFDSEETEEGEVATEEEAAKEPEKPKPAPAMYFPIKPAFVVNFLSRGRQRFLQVDVTIMTRNQQVYSSIQTHLPLIKNRLVMLFGGQVYEELQTDEGRELMRQQALEAVKDVMETETGASDIDQVLFTNFVMQ